MEMNVKRDVRVILDMSLAEVIMVKRLIDLAVSVAPDDGTTVRGQGFSRELGNVISEAHQ